MNHIASLPLQQILGEYPTFEEIRCRASVCRRWRDEIDPVCRKLFCDFHIDVPNHDAFRLYLALGRRIHQLQPKITEEDDILYDKRLNLSFILQELTERIQSIYDTHILVSDKINHDEVIEIIKEDLIHKPGGSQLLTLVIHHLGILKLAVQENRFFCARDILSKDPKVPFKLMGVAVKNGNDQMIELLISAGGRFSPVFLEHFPAHKKMLFKKYIKRVKYIRLDGTFVRAIAKFDQIRHLGTIEKLGVCVKELSYELSPTYIAAKYGSKRVLKRLLNEDCKVDPNAKESEAALFTARIRDQRECYQILVDADFPKEMLIREYIYAFGNCNFWALPILEKKIHVKESLKLLGLMFISGMVGIYFMSYDLKEDLILDDSCW